MNDPWDVKSRQAGQYVSCMRLNGVPLLPPVLSLECRKEMQYYKLLAKEVEKRISELKAFVGESEDEATQAKTDAPESPQEYGQPSERVRQIYPVFDSNHTTFKEEKADESSSDANSPDLCNSLSSYSTMSPSLPKFSVDVSIHSESNKSIKPADISKHTPQPIELPERDCNPSPKTKTPIVLKHANETFGSNKDIVNMLTVKFDLSQVEPILSRPLPDMSIIEGPASLGSKSFTGSLNNIHSESVKELPALTRQSSYTVLNPSPLLIAHLRVQSVTTGVDVTSISMSDSLSNLNTPKKRRSWDLESAKMKWSSMAHELKQKTSSNPKPNDPISGSRPTYRKPRQPSPKSKSVQEKHRRASLPGKTPKSEPCPKPKSNPSPHVTNSKTIKQSKLTNDNQTAPKKPTTNNQASPEKETPCNQTSPKNLSHNNQSTPKKLISESEDPATKVKELYEKIQNQQMLQMANLIEKQKREQMLLQQVFDEQNSILYRQLKTICPKSPVEAKAAWADKVNRGPVSLSQLINHQSPDISVTTTLADTHNNLSKCAEVLKRSKDITDSIHKPGSPTDGSRTRTHSPNHKISRKLSYDTSSTDREFEPILTDRTNDTLAGLNVTFTSDSDDPTLQRAPQDLVNSKERQHPPLLSVRRVVPAKVPPTPQELAAASTIVAYAKGYLVRRLLRTERVQATVQTIRDALLCALQMHQDRAGIKGADVDLHRRLIQQITAACYSLHDTFVASTPAERCALIAADRERERERRHKPPPVRHYRQKTDIMSHSHSGAFPARAPRTGPALMTHSNYETFSGTKLNSRRVPSPRRRPWR